MRHKASWAFLAIFSAIGAGSFVGCALLRDGKVTPEAVAAIQAKQAELQANVAKQQEAAEARLAAALTSGDARALEQAKKDAALVAKARDYLSKGTAAVNLILQPDGTIDIAQAAGLLNAIPGWGQAAALAVALGAPLIGLAKQASKLSTARTSTAEAEKALSALWNVIPDVPGPEDKLPPAILATINKVDAKATAA